ncbi:unnamed protein product [Caenorhabditis auriculariae]|uniref:C3H1-type domain-containing protein n=1 Tax=Caenorhabditis auriculariae TaxID=2777116 RepID=A0A8S1HDS0_9PELO|nr:unnamed protein product [Caenorhabditis auriculariae]
MPRLGVNLSDAVRLYSQHADGFRIILRSRRYVFSLLIIFSEIKHKSVLLQSYAAAFTQVHGDKIEESQWHSTCGKRDETERGGSLQNVDCAIGDGKGDAHAEASFASSALFALAVQISAVCSRLFSIPQAACAIRVASFRAEDSSKVVQQMFELGMGLGGGRKLFDASLTSSLGGSGDSSSSGSPPNSFDHGGASLDRPSWLFGTIAAFSVVILNPNGVQSAAPFGCVEPHTVRTASICKLAETRDNVPAGEAGSAGSSAAPILIEISRQCSAHYVTSSKKPLISANDPRTRESRRCTSVFARPTFTGLQNVMRSGTQPSESESDGVSTQVSFHSMLFYRVLPSTHARFFCLRDHAAARQQLLLTSRQTVTNFLPIPTSLDDGVLTPHMSLDNYHQSFLKSLYGSNSGGAPGTTPTDALSSLLDPFANVSPIGTFSAGDVMTGEPRNFTIGQLTGVPYKHADRQPIRNTSYSSSNLFSEFSNPLGAPGTPIGSMSPAVGVQSFGASTPSSNTPTNTSGNVPPPKNPKLYKTELCRSWMDHGRCNYGERCQYAHGETEKRPIPRHPKYKTEACQSFHQTGYCPYGPRCHFIHNETELLTNAQSRQPSSQSTPSAAPNQSSLFSNLGSRSQISAVPSSVLQRVYSLPGYGSAGESPAGSSNDSGSESPNGSFSPGLELEDNGPFTVGFMSTPQKTRSQPPTQQAQRYLAYEQAKPMNETQMSSLLGDVIGWSLEDSLSNKWEDATPGRLPDFIFGQYSGGRVAFHNNLRRTESEGRDGYQCNKGQWELRAAESPIISLMNSFRHVDGPYAFSKTFWWSLEKCMVFWLWFVIPFVFFFIFSSIVRIVKFVWLFVCRRRSALQLVEFERMMQNVAGGSFIGTPLSPNEQVLRAVCCCEDRTDGAALQRTTELQRVDPLMPIRFTATGAVLHSPSFALTATTSGITSEFF